MSKTFPAALFLFHVAWHFRQEAGCSMLDAEGACYIFFKKNFDLAESL